MKYFAESFCIQKFEEKSKYLNYMFNHGFFEKYIVNEFCDACWSRQ